MAKIKDHSHCSIEASTEPFYLVPNGEMHAMKQLQMTNRPATSNSQHAMTVQVPMHKRLSSDAKHHRLIGDQRLVPPDFINSQTKAMSIVRKP